MAVKQFIGTKNINCHFVSQIVVDKDVKYGKTKAPYCYGIYFCLQCASSEVMAIRASRCYEPTSKAIVLANGTPLTMENMIAAGQPREYTELVFKLCEDLAKIGSDNAEYALFTAIAIFSGKMYTD